jgi:hypothetical protein
MMIRMPRGDIRLVRFLVNDPNGTATDIDFTEVYFTVKKTSKDRLYQFQKRLSTGGITKLDLGDYQVKIEPEDTSKMMYGNFKFDVQLLYEDQLKETFVGDFVLTDEITFNENE